MARLTLPQDTPLLSSAPVQFRASKGQAVLADEPRFPHFWVRWEDVHAAMGPAAAVLGRYFSVGRDGLPAQLTDQGLQTDPDWAVFNAFSYATDPAVREAPSLAIEAVEEGRLPWSLACPVVEGHHSLIGKIIECHDQSMSCGRGFFDEPDASRPRDGLSEFLQAHSLERALTPVVLAGRADELAAFRDRDKSLLDLAADHQQWRFAQWLWDHGVRFSPEALREGRPLEALIAASAFLQGPLIFHANDAVGHRIHARLAWLKAWQRRCQDAGVATNPAPALGLRARRARARNWEAGQAIVDTPASLWVARFAPAVLAMRGPMPVESQPPHVPAIVACWMDFWRAAGVDLDAVPVPVSSEKPDAEGFAGFWEDARHLDSWQRWRHAFVLDRQLPSPVHPSRPVRL